MKVVGITTTHSKKELYKKVDMAITDFSNLNMDMLKKLNKMASGFGI